MNDDELDRRLRRLDRMAEAHVPEAVLDGVHAAARAVGARSSNRRFSLIAGLTVFALGGVAAAPTLADTVEQWLATSGWQPAVGNEFIPGSETVDLTAPDLPDYIASRYPEWLPLPAGTTRQDLIDAVIEVWTHAPEGQRYTQEVGIRYSFEQYAVCGWIEIARTSDDPAVVAHASVVMRDAATWPAIAAYETVLGDATDIPEVLTAAADATGDPATISQAAWRLGCPGATVP